MIEIELNFRDTERITKASAEAMGLAVRGGIRKAQKHLKKEMPRIISRHTGVKISAVRKEIENFLRPTVRNPATGLSLHNKKFYLHQFPHRETKTGVTASPYRSASQFPHAFKVKGSGLQGGKIMRRDKNDDRYDGRYPIKPPASVRLLLTKEVKSEIDKAANYMVGDEINRILHERGII